MNSFRSLLFSLTFVFLIESEAHAINPEEVLVVYNSLAANYDSAVLTAYQAAHPGTSGVNAPRYLDLATNGIATADISYTNFVSQIRDPIRSYIDTTLGSSNRSDIKAIQILKSVPHRILDPFPNVGGGGLGDDAGQASTEINADNYQSASVDAELTLLWQDLNTGQSGAAMSSYSDQFIVNPYFNSSTDFDSFSRANIDTAKTLDAVDIGVQLWQSSTSVPVAQQLRPGDLVLVARLDGNSTADITNAIQRANNLQVNPAQSGILLDEDNRSTGLDNGLFASRTNIYEQTVNYISNVSTNNWNLTYDNSNNFIIGTEYNGSNIVLYASYGVNHNNDSGQDNSSYIDTFAGEIAPGALFVTYESYDGRKFNGLGDNGQEQVADFLSAGGTFGLGLVWEPFAFSVGDTEVLARQWLDGGVTFFEAAYLSTPALSWQNIVIGDGLGTITIIPEPGALLGLIAGGLGMLALRRRNNLPKA